MPQQSRPEDSIGAAERLQVLAMHALPHHLLSKVMRTATRLRLRAWKEWQIRWFIQRYGVDMSQALQPDSLSYVDFNSFFTRALKPAARPLCDLPGGMACPADGVLSQAGTVLQDTLVQAKGQSYSLRALLGTEPELAASFEGGPYATIYLSPRDYHRVHMPLSGRLISMTHIPGRLFSVSPASVRTVRGLFARNERVVSLFETDLGLLAVVLVGAVFVGSIEQVWCGALPPRPRGTPRITRYDDQHIRLERGAEMGRFNMGSTVIVALANSDVSWSPDLLPARALLMGECLTAPSGGA